MWPSRELFGVRLWKCGSMALGGAARPTLISAAPTGEHKPAAARAAAAAIALIERMRANLPCCVATDSVAIVSPLHDFPQGTIAARLRARCNGSGHLTPRRLPDLAAPRAEVPDPCPFIANSKGQSAGATTRYCSRICGSGR